MVTYRETGIVLRTHKLGESDRIAVILTRDRGQVRVVAKGVRRTSSRIGARVEPLSLVDVQCYEGRNLDSLTQVECLAPLGAQLAADYAKWTSAQVMVETVERLTSEEGEPARQQFLLLLGALRALVVGEHASGLVLDAFLLRSLAISGWAPSFLDCARCGEPGPHRYFHPGAGGALCRDCKVPGSASPSVGAMELMGALLTGEWERADASTDRQRRECAGLTARYVQWHLERGLRSLPLVERG